MSDYKDYKDYTLKYTGEGWYVDYSPTGNCQVFTIMYFDKMLIKYTNDTELMKEVILAGSSVGRVRQMLIDVKAYHCERIDRIFKDHIVFKTPYKSTNDSNMCMYLIKVPYRLY